VNLLQLVIVLSVLAFLFIRPRWRKTGMVLLALWGVALMSGVRLVGAGLLLPAMSLPMLLKSSGKRKGERASPAPSPSTAEETSGLACGACGARVESEAAFCQACGQALRSEASAEEEPRGGDDTHDADAGGLPVERAVAPGSDPPPAHESSFEELRRSVLETVKAQLGGGDLLYDDEGSLPLRWGSSAVLVRVLSEPLSVEVSSPCLLRVAMTPPLLEAVNDLNGRLPFPGRVFVKNEAVIVASGLFGEPFVGGHFGRLCAAVGETADQLDDQLKVLFGGALVSDVDTAKGAGTDSGSWPE